MSGPQPWPPHSPGAWSGARRDPSPGRPPRQPPWAPPPRRKRRSRWLTVGLPIGVLLLLGGCGALAVLAFGAITGSLGPARDAADAYARALVDRRWDDAHAMLCAPARADLTPDDLATLHGDPPLTAHRIDGVHVSSSNGQASGEVTLTFQTEDGLEDRTVVFLAREDGVWRPCP